MNHLPRLFVAACFGLSVVSASAAHATSPVPVAMGASWDGPGHDLQGIVDSYIGIPGAIDVRTDFIGAHAGDLDPWFWVGGRVPAFLITEVAGNSATNELGWYLETFARPVIDGLDDGIVFDGPSSDGADVTIVFPSSSTKFGFYLDTHTLVQTPEGPRDQVFFTDRMLNDAGPAGAGAIHGVTDGDVQALVFDVSEWKGPNTWLVCFEDSDAGALIQPCCDGTDADYNDVVFQVRASGATPAILTTFGAIKSIYR